MCLTHVCQALSEFNTNVYMLGDAVAGARQRPHGPALALAARPASLAGGGARAMFLKKKQI